jgi:hypothetical protein
VILAAGGIVNQPLGREMLDAARAVLASASCKKAFMAVDSLRSDAVETRKLMVCCQCFDFISSIRLVDPFPTDKLCGERMLSKQNCSAHGYAMLAKPLFSCHISECSPLIAAAVEDIR